MGIGSGLWSEIHLAAAALHPARLCVPNGGAAALEERLHIPIDERRMGLDVHKMATKDCLGTGFLEEDRSQRRQLFSRAYDPIRGRPERGIKAVLLGSRLARW